MNGHGKQIPSDSLQRALYREFLLEPGLYQEAGLDDLPRRLADLLGCDEEEAVERLTESALLEDLTSEQLRDLLAIRDMVLFSRTAATVAAELKDPRATYDRCIRLALCYGVIGRHGHVFSALRAAAAKNDGFARHHHLYGIMLGLQGNQERALWELGMALEYEPYSEGKERILSIKGLLKRAA